MDQQNKHVCPEKKNEKKSTSGSEPLKIVYELLSQHIFHTNSPQKQFFPPFYDTRNVTDPDPVLFNPLDPGSELSFSWSRISEP